MKKIETACIIDDDEIFIFATKKLLQIKDFCNDFLIFHNGLEAINYLRPLIENGEKCPDVILLDLNMPVMDGWQFLDEFITIPNYKKVTIYIVSSSIDQRDILRAKQYDCVSNYFIKPMSTESLNEILSGVQVK